MNYRFPRLFSPMPRVENRQHTPTNDPPETNFLQTLVECDSEVEPRCATPWGMALGMAVILGISGSFWTGVGLLIARLSR